MASVTDLVLGGTRGAMPTQSQSLGGWREAHRGGPGDPHSGTGNLMGRSLLLGKLRRVAVAQILSWGMVALGTLGGSGCQGEGEGLQAPSAPGVSPALDGERGERSVVVTTKMFLWSDLKFMGRLIRD